MKKSERFKKILAYFSEHHPVAETELLHSNPYELLVATILSAQCTDKRVNMVTPAFFQHYPTVEKLAESTPETIFQFIRSISYPNNKAKHLSGMAKMLVQEYNSVVPSDEKLLQKLPGVGRKTAHVVASVIFNKPLLAVDTHVFRVAARLGLSTQAKTPLETEKQLVRYIPDEKIPVAHHWLILHGRYICTAKKPKCEICEIKEFCKYFENRNS